MHIDLAPGGVDHSHLAINIRTAHRILLGLQGRPDGVLDNVGGDPLMASPRQAANATSCHPPRPLPQRRRPRTVTDPPMSISRIVVTTYRRHIVLNAHACMGDLSELDPLWTGVAELRFA